MSTSLAAVNPATGEVLEHLAQQPPEMLAEALQEIQNRQADLKRWAGAVEGELRRRLKVREVRFAQFGAYEVRLAGGRRSEWDADGLEAVLRYLVDEGHVTAAEVAEVITRPPVVSRSKAKALRDRLDGGARNAVDACCTWRDAPTKLTVARSVELSPAAADGALHTAGSAELPVSNLDHEELFR